MATSNKAEQDPRSKKLWFRSIIIFSVAFVAVIGGVIYYGSVSLPAMNKAKDVTACQTFLKGYGAAQIAFLKEAAATDHAPSAKTAVANYAEVLVTAYNKAFKQATKDGVVYNGIVDIAKQRLTLDVTDTATLQQQFTSLDGAAKMEEEICSGALEAAHAKNPLTPVKASPSPSASN
jgi:hypothetical protein